MESFSFELNIDKTIKGTCYFNDEKIVLISTHKNKRNASNLIKNLNKIVSVQKVGSIIRIKLKKDPYIEFDTKTGILKKVNELTSFETRMLSRALPANMLPYPRSKERQLVTDLHTHFTAALPPIWLINCAKGHGVSFPKKMLEKAGINTKSLPLTENGEYLLEDVVSTPENYKALVASMKIDTSEQETFNRLENIYSFRNLITRNHNMFEPMIWETARDAKRKKIKYMELSLSTIISNIVELKKLEKILPEVEKETGVRLRFLGAISRHSEKERIMDETERLKILTRSPYILGCDFMGHETNSTQSFYQAIKELAKHAIKNDPYFVIRVHAGENPIFKNNVRLVLLAVEEAHSECVNEMNGKTIPYPQVRIGHGVYGFNEAPASNEVDEFPKISTLDLCKKINPIIEFNMSSNLSLNNIDDLDEIPIKKYVDNGIRVVLGTDGRGIYSTTIAQEMILAKQAGLTKSDFEKIRKTENKIIKRENERYKKLVNNSQSSSVAIESDLNKLKVHYSPDVIENNKKENEQILASLSSKIELTGAETDPQKVKRVIKGKKPIMITGSSLLHWEKLKNKKEQVSRIRIVLDVLVHAINPKKAYLVTGGTNYGVEKELHKIAHEYNIQNSEKIVVLGTLTEEIVSDPKNNAVEKNTITHAMIPLLNGKPAKKWFDLLDTVLNLLQEEKGILIAIAGGSIVSDIIQRSHNMGLNMALMSNVAGASGDKAKSLAGNGYNFYDGKDLLKKLSLKNENILKKDMDEEKLKEIYDTAVKREAKRLEELRNVKQKSKRKKFK